MGTRLLAKDWLLAYLQILAAIGLRPGPETVVTDRNRLLNFCQVGWKLEGGTVQFVHGLKGQREAARCLSVATMASIGAYAEGHVQDPVWKRSFQSEPWCKTAIMSGFKSSLAPGALQYDRIVCRRLDGLRIPG